jgi:GxxExxY protein
VSLIHEELSRSVIGAGMAVLTALRPGLDEKRYENALVIELEEQGHAISQQENFEVQYKGRYIGNLIPDMIVDEKIIVETKVVSDFNDTHTAQVMGYLAITGYRLGLLLNFKHHRLKWKRVVR